MQYIEYVSNIQKKIYIQNQYIKLITDLQNYNKFKYL